MKNLLDNPFLLLVLALVVIAVLAVVTVVVVFMVLSSRKTLRAQRRPGDDGQAR